MRKIVVTEFVTLDGVMEDPGGAEKSKHGGWAFQFNRGPEGDKFKFDELLASDALLLGRVTYQGFAAAWPSIKDESGFADRMNGISKYVVSTTLQQAGWNNSHLIKSQVVEQVSKLKTMPGQDILVAGSGQLVRTLMQHDLVDEYRLMVYPVILGGGKRLFQDGSDRRALRLVEAKPVGSGILTLVYRPERK
ncbi:MAG TPA: dihydrofolate reductase family protein [Anaerolineae bacterium]